MSAKFEVQFLRSLQRLLDEGLFTSTYKFALLQALADLAVERESEPDGSLRLPVAAIAEKFMEYYWRQVLPFGLPAGEDAAQSARHGGESAILLQNTGGQAAVLRLLADCRARYDGNMVLARQAAADWNRLRNSVAVVIRQMPLWKLQTIGNQSEEFLYRKSEYRAADGTIRLLPGIPAALCNFHGMVTNLVRGAWVEQVRRIPGNRPLIGETAALDEFLFGAERAALDGYREVLRDHQRGRCFYCRQPVRRAGELDHFIAWSRYPVDLGHNFVFAHTDCNRDKRDYLAHPDHLARWREQNLEQGEALAQHFSDMRLIHDAGRSRQIALWAYGQGELSGAHVWVKAKTIRPLPRGWRQALDSTRLDLAAERP